MEVVRHRAKVERAERLSDQLDVGIAWAAHELRGPVLTAMAALDVVLQGGASPDLERNLLQRSRAELQVLAHDVDALLRWAGEAASHTSAVVDLVEVAEASLDSTAFAQGDGRVVLDVREGAKVRGSAVHLRRAIANVVRNALQYSPQGSTVRVTMAKKGRFAIISVTDHGAGIADAERERIFDPFVRGRAASTEGSGSGLGLFVARRVIESHGGWIRVESSEDGTTFRIGLPVATGRRS
jgi:two-component system heavy metal sensor histidine kinase CusS